MEHTDSVEVGPISEEQAAPESEPPGTPPHSPPAAPPATLTSVAAGTTRGTPRVKPRSVSGRRPPVEAPPARGGTAKVKSRLRSSLGSAKPWTLPADVAFPISLNKTSSPELDRLVSMPEGSALTVSRIGLDGSISSVEWRGTGEWGFYPASTVKLVTAAMTLEFLERYELPIDSVACVGDDTPMTFRELLSEMIVVSGNETFNTLQECVGFAETYREMQRWGVTKARIRRHFRVPRYNHSREVRVLGPGGKELLRLQPRPAVEIPLHDGNGEGGGQGIHNLESNWWCSDDLVRAMAAIMFGPTRRRRHFEDLVGWCSFTNQCRIREGLRELTAQKSTHPSFVVLNKPGWWEPDLANVEMGYVYDVERSAHYVVGIYFHGTMAQSEPGMREAARELFRWVSTTDF